MIWKYCIQVHVLYTLFEYENKGVGIYTQYTYSRVLAKQKASIASLACRGVNVIYSKIQTDLQVRLKVIRREALLRRPVDVSCHANRPHSRDTKTGSRIRTYTFVPINDDCDLARWMIYRKPLPNNNRSFGLRS